MGRIFLLAALAMPVGGCSLFSFCGYLFAPEMKETTVDAEFDQLPGRRVAVVVFAQPGIDYAHPQARVSLSEAVAHDLKQNVKNITMIPAATVRKFQRENLDWYALPRRELARRLGVDYVLHLGLEEYSMADPNSGMFRARITTDVNLYTAAPAPDAVGGDTPVWTGRIRVVYPDDNDRAIVASDDRAARADAHALYAKLLARKFYQHKIKADE